MTITLKAIPFQLSLLTLFFMVGSVAPVLAQTPVSQTAPPAPTVTVNGTPAAYSSGIKINYIRSWEPSKAISDPSLVTGSTSTADVKQTTQYFDGLGRPLQTVSRGISPAGLDLVAPVIYDAFGREQFKYLPYAVSGTGLFRLNPFGEQASFSATQYPGESVWYSETQFEASPLNRIDKVMAPGNSWAGNGKGVSSQYLLNTLGDSVKIWDIGFTPGDYPIARSADYGAGQCSKQ